MTVVRVREALIICQGNQGKLVYGVWGFFLANGIKIKKGDVLQTDTLSLYNLMVETCVQDIDIYRFSLSVTRD